MSKLRVLLLAVAACLAATVTACGGQQANDAQKVAAGIVKDMAAVHPETICDNGDGGDSLDNNIPWYTIWLYADDRPELEQVVVDAAAKAGYHLVPGGEGLVAAVDGRKVQASVVRTGEVTIRCADIDRWGAAAPVRPGRAIVTLDVTLPER
jgi:hypothetical protein